MDFETNQRFEIICENKKTCVYGLKQSYSILTITSLKALDTYCFYFHTLYRLVILAHLSLITSGINACLHTHMNSTYINIYNT